MPAAAAPPPHKSRRGNQAFTLDADELARRLSIVIAEEKVRELERKRSNWEADLLQARREQADRMPTRSQSSPFEDRGAKRPSIALGPTQLPPACDSPPPQRSRKTSLPCVVRPQDGAQGGPQGSPGGSQRSQATYVPPHVAAPFLAPTTPRKPTGLKRDPALDLETIEEVDRVSKETRRPDSSLAEDQREWSPVLWRVEEDCGPDDVEAEMRSQSGSRGRPSLLDKLEHYWRFHTDHTSDDAHAFHSDESTLRGSWMGSLRSSVASRKPSSIIKRVENYWAVKVSGEDDEAGRDNFRAESDASMVKTLAVSRKRSGFFSKLKI